MEISLRTSSRPVRLPSGGGGELGTRRFGELLDEAPDDRWREQEVPGPSPHRNG